MSILPTALPAAIKGCLLACTLTVTPGNYGDLKLANLTATVMATVDLTGSTFTSVYLSRDANLVLLNGTVSNPATTAKCWSIDFSTNITLAGSTATQCGTVGFSLARSTNVRLDHWTATAMGCDGVDVVGVTNFAVTHGTETGSNATGACHPDAVQLYAYGAYPVRNGVVSDNTIVSGNFMRPDGKSRGQRGIDGDTRDGPMDYITVTANNMSLYGGSCLQFEHIAHLTARGNICHNLRPQPWPSRFIFTGSAGVLGPNTIK